MTQVDIDSLYRQTARARFDTGEGDVIVSEDDTVEIDGERGGAWVSAQLWVPSDALEPQPGPTYDVWIAERSEAVAAPGGFVPGPWVWVDSGTTFTCDDDPDGRGAWASAHEYARFLRSVYPCAFIAVRPAGKPPLPIAEGCE